MMVIQGNTELLRDLLVEAGLDLERVDFVPSLVPTDVAADDPYDVIIAVNYPDKTVAHADGMGWQRAWYSVSVVGVWLVSEALDDALDCLRAAAVLAGHVQGDLL